MSKLTRVFILTSLLAAIIFLSSDTTIVSGPGITLSGFCNFIARVLEDEIVGSLIPEESLATELEGRICSGGVLDGCRLTSGYGLRIHPIFRRRMFHHGIDLAAARGAPIFSPADGVVVSAGWHGGYGLDVVIDHGYGWKSRYAHLIRSKVKRGAYVRQGEVIGAVGSTGVSTGPHLHFEMRYLGRTVDPRIYYPALSEFTSLLAWQKPPVTSPSTDS